MDSNGQGWIVSNFIVMNGEDVCQTVFFSCVHVFSIENVITGYY